MLVLSSSPSLRKVEERGLACTEKIGREEAIPAEQIPLGICNLHYLELISCYNHSELN